MGRHRSRRQAPAVKKADWCDALLLANTQRLLLAQPAFGIAKEGDAILIMRIPPGHDHPRFLCVDLDGLVTMCNALSDGASSCHQALRGVAHTGCTRTLRWLPLHQEQAHDGH